MTLVYSPPWSTRAIASIAVTLLLLAAVRWFRENRRQRRPATRDGDRRIPAVRSRRSFAANDAFPLLLRLVTIALLVFVMLNPQSLLPRERPNKPKLAILLDT